MFGFDWSSLTYLSDIDETIETYLSGNTSGIFLFLPDRHGEHHVSHKYTSGTQMACCLPVPLS